MFYNQCYSTLFEKHILYHAGTAILVIYILFTALHIHHIPIFHENIYFFPCHRGLIPNFHVICIQLQSLSFLRVFFENDERKRISYLEKNDFFYLERDAGPKGLRGLETRNLC